MAASPRPHSTRWLIPALLLGLLLQTFPGTGEGGTSANRTAGQRVYLPLIRTSQPSLPLTGIELIDADEVAGKITAEQAALCRVQAVMGVPELRQEYQISPALKRKVDATIVIERIWEQWPGFSPTGQAALRPYLVRPNHPDSRFQTLVAGAQASGAPADGRPPAVVLVSEAANGRIAVWGTTTDSGAAAAVATQLGLLAADNLLKPMENLMGKTWDGDTGLHALAQDGLLGFGGANPDGQLDVYVVPYGSPGVTYRDDNLPSASFVIINSAETADLRKTSVVHELFHVIENRFASKAPAGDTKWWREASANWAVYRFLPASPAVYVEHAQSLLDHPEWALSRWSAGSQDERLHAYGGFLWPAVFDGQSGTKMGTIWAKMADLPPAEAIKDVLGDRYLRYYDDFLVNNWNRPYVNRGAYGPAGYDQIAPLLNSTPGGPRRVPDAKLSTVVVDAAGATYKEITSVKPNLEPLSGAYYMLRVSPETRQVLVVLEDWTKLGDTTASAFFRRTTEGVSGEDWPASPRTDHLLEWTEPDGSTYNWRYLCRDMKDTNWADILLTLGNASPTASRSATVKIIASTVACRWQGSVTGAGSSFQANEPEGDHLEEFVDYNFTITGAWLPPEAPLGICDIYSDEWFCTATSYPKLSTLYPLGAAGIHDNTQLVFHITHRDILTSGNGVECVDGYTLDYTGRASWYGDATNRLHIHGANYGMATLYLQYHNRCSADEKPCSSSPFTISNVPGCQPQEYLTPDVTAHVLIGAALSPHTPEAPSNPKCVAPTLTVSGNGSTIAGQYSYQVTGTYDTPACSEGGGGVYAWNEGFSLQANLTRAPEP